MSRKPTRKKGKGEEIGDGAVGATRIEQGVLKIVLGALIAALALLISGASAGPTQAQDVEPQIVGGQPVEDGQYPFMVSLYYQPMGPGPGSHFCGGTLIDADSVLTAAHCLDNLYASDMEVVVGRTVLNNPNPGYEGYIRTVSARYQHPRFERSTKKRDVAVLKLDAPVPGTIEPIKPADETQDRLEEPGRLLTVTGWGDTDNRMRRARVPVVSDDEAVRAWNGDIKFFYPPLMVAAGDGSRDACDGDSGGPLFERNDAGNFIQVGITSFGRDCASQTHPGVYTEVNEPSIRSFILEKANM